MVEISPRRSNHHVTRSPTSKVDHEKIIEILPNQLYFTCFRENSQILDKTVDGNISYISFHGKFHYEPFYHDFGPWNLSVLYHLCVHIDKLVEIEQSRGRKLVMFCYDEKNGDFQKVRVNCAYVLGAYLIIYHGYTADDAYLAVSAEQPSKFIGFRDASMGEPTYLLHIHDVLRGVEKALRLNWLDFTAFDYVEYEHYERVENGDFNWIIPNKILSFCGPHNESRIQDGYPYHSPEVYFDYFRETGISTIVRLNAKNYNANKFVKAGFDHVDLFFVDGSTPSDEIVEKFIRVVDMAKGGVAVHCKAGLGRTGTLIACWMMKEFGLTACECMAWLRICRPGSVIGPQQRFLIDKQKMCWSLSISNGVHLPSGASKRDSEKTLAVKKLTSQVDEIHLGKPSNSKDNTRQRSRPNILPLRRKLVPRTNQETKLDEEGRSQGDRLLALKAQHQNEKEKGIIVLPNTKEDKTINRNPIRYSKFMENALIVPSQAYLNRNREPISPKDSTKLARVYSSNGSIASRTRNSTASCSSTLSRTPASAIFPSMAARRSEMTRFSSPTTPIKPMSPATASPLTPLSTRLNSTPRLRSENSGLPNGVHLQPQITRCTVSSSEAKKPRRALTTMVASKSTSAIRKIQLSRPRPYPPHGVRVELCANGNHYELRPRVGSRMECALPGSGLATNTDALLGNRRHKH